jgi:hypothetical protein
LAFREYDSNGTLGNEVHHYPVIVDNIATNFALTSTAINDGNSLWSANSVATGFEPTVTVTLNSYSPKLHAELLGGSFSYSGSEDMFTVGEEGLIPSSASYTVTLAHNYKSGGFIAVCGTDGSPWVKTASAPAAKQYSISATTLTFNSADAGAEIYATYEWTDPDASHMELPSEINPKTVQLLISGKAEPASGGASKTLNLTFDRAKVTGATALPALSKTPGNWQLPFTILKPRNTRNAVDLKLGG